jgi:hypothetical protein
MIPLFMMFAGGPMGTGHQWYESVNLLFPKISVLFYFVDLIPFLVLLS